MSGIWMGLLAAVLFGASTPAGKALLGTLTPFQLAGLLYLGAAIGSAPWAWLQNRGAATRVHRPSVVRLGLAVFAGGCLAPVLLLLALSSSSAGSISLMLNFEVAATALLGVLFFHQHLTRLGVAGVVGVFVAGLLLTFGGGAPGLVAALAALGACVLWAADNHLSSLIDGITPAGTTFWKGLIAGAVNLMVGLLIAPLHASGSSILLALGVGALGYGASIILYVSSAQQLGATRAQGLFATAPFIGAGLSVVLLGESFNALQLGAAILIAVSVALLLRSQHEHTHIHPAIEHTHVHGHVDGHHEHAHPELQPSTIHVHLHTHEQFAHCGPHWPDLHHRHEHA